MMIIYALAESQQQSQRRLRLHPVIKPWLSCYYRTSFMAVTVSLGRPFPRTISSIFRTYMASNTMEKSTNTCLPRDFCTNSFYVDGLSEALILWITLSRNHLDSFQFLVRCDWEEDYHKSFPPWMFLVIPRSRFLANGWKQFFVHLCIVLYYITALQYWSSKT